MPGFLDFHIHLFLGSLSHVSVSISNAKSEIEAAEMVKKFADERPNDPWIFGFNWITLIGKKRSCLIDEPSINSFQTDQYFYLMKNVMVHG
jgi:predicted amidohydrolase YtcJ